MGSFYSPFVVFDDAGHRQHVDGKEEAVSLIGEAMVGVKLTKGTHTVTFRYENGAYETGRIITLLSILAFAALIGLHRYYKKKYTEA